MIDIIRGEVVERDEYGLRFFVDSGGGCEFPCDKDGKVKDLNPAAQENYEYCLAHPEKYTYSFNEVVHYRRSWREPNIGICHCGERFPLVNEYMGACECPRCHKWYNLAGQELNDPSTWSEGDDW